MGFLVGLILKTGMPERLARIAANVVVILLALGVVGIIIWRIDASAREEGRREVQAKWDAAIAAANALGEKIEDAQTDIIVEAAVAQAAVQERVIIRTEKVRKEVPIYVKNDSHCITYGLVRVLDAGALGTGAADLPLAAGQSDNACAPVAWTALAEHIISNYGIAHQNAAQLDGLIDAVKRISAERGH